eukprot:TCONS_00009926-protein
MIEHENIQKRPLSPGKQDILWAFYVPICSIICIFGILGNIISLIVWRKLRNRFRARNVSTTTYFMLLSAIDMAVLITTLFVMVLPYAEHSVFKSRSYAFFFSYIGHPIHFFLIFLSIYMVMAMSLDRVRLVYRPFSRYDINQHKVYLMITIFTGVAFVLNIPSFFEYRPTLNKQNTWELTELRYLNRRAFRDAVFVTHCIGVIMVPWMTMFISNILLIFKSSNRLRNMRNITTKDEPNADHKQLTYTLILVSALSLFLLAVQCVARCITMFYFVDNHNWNNIFFGREIGNLTLPINSALNFVLFCLPGKRFRKELRRLLRRYLCRHQ